MLSNFRGNQQQNCCLHEECSNSDLTKTLRSARNETDEVKSNKFRNRKILNANQAAEIYMISTRSSFVKDLIEGGTKTKGASVLVSRLYSVSPKTIRDIWNRRTWRSATRHLWLPGHDETCPDDNNATSSAFRCSPTPSSVDQLHHHPLKNCARSSPHPSPFHSTTLVASTAASHAEAAASLLRRLASTSVASHLHWQKQRRGPTDTRGAPTKPADAGALRPAALPSSLPADVDGAAPPRGGDNVGGGGDVSGGCRDEGGGDCICAVRDGGDFSLHAARTTARTAHDVSALPPLHPPPITKGLLDPTHSPPLDAARELRPRVSGVSNRASGGDEDKDNTLLAVRRAAAGVICWDANPSIPTTVLPMATSSAPSSSSSISSFPSSCCSSAAITADAVVFVWAPSGSEAPSAHCWGDDLQAEASGCLEAGRGGTAGKEDLGRWYPFFLR